MSRWAPGWRLGHGASAGGFMRVSTCYCLDLSQLTDSFKPTLRLFPGPVSAVSTRRVTWAARCSAGYLQGGCSAAVSLSAGQLGAERGNHVVFPHQSSNQRRGLCHDILTEQQRIWNTRCLQCGGI